jgi:phage FluMu gp28-like protein
MQMAEELQTKYGTWRVEPVTFSLPVKEDLAVRSKRVYEDSTIRIPDDRNLRGAIHAVRKIPTAAGNIRFDADRTEAGHADEFWAQALALLAGDNGGVCTLGMQTSGVGTSYSRLGGYV